MIIVNGWANGGGYFRGGVERTGSVIGFEPRDTEKIQILEEKLTAALGPSEAHVEVNYTMQNVTNKKVTVRFGFPVEESFDHDLMQDEADLTQESPKLDRLKYCQDYQITAAGKSVSAKWKQEKNPLADKRFKGLAGWFISEINFAAGEKKPVAIRYRSGYPVESWNVSDDTSENALLFRYRLSTAACWAGPIGSGKITLQPAGIDPRELKVLKPVNRFKKTGEAWVWEFKNLEPTLADDLEIEVCPEVREHNGSKTSRYVERGTTWLLAHTNYQVTASSVLPPAADIDYAAANVKNLWAQGTWSEGAAGPGVGEWLELKPEVPRPLVALEMMPGYFQSEELFRANARPRTVKITLNGEHQFITNIPDLQAACRIPVSGYTKPVKKIRLTFQQVWPGTKFEDLCVSRIKLEVKLDKKPTIEPVR